VSTTATHLRGEEQQEGHHEGEQTSGFGEGESQNGVGEELSTQSRVASNTSDEGSENRSDTLTGSDQADSSDTRADNLSGRHESGSLTSDTANLEVVDGAEGGWVADGFAG